MSIEEYYSYSNYKQKPQQHRRTFVKKFLASVTSFCVFLTKEEGGDDKERGSNDNDREVKTVEKLKCCLQKK